MPDTPIVLLAAGGLGVEEIALRLAVALVIGGVIALVCRHSVRRSGAAAFPLLFSLVLLPALVAMTTIVIADNVARAFGLVGALSIVRFRTIVEDTRDTVFIVFAVAAGMAVGAGDAPVWLLGVPLVSLAALALSLWGRPTDRVTATMRLEVRLGLGNDPDAVVLPVLERHAHRVRLTGVATAREGAATDCHYRLLLAPVAVHGLAADLRGVAAVQGFEIAEE